MKTFIQNGDVITVTAPSGAVTSGQGVLIGSLFSVATFDAAEGQSVEFATRGVFDLPKEPTTVFTVGDRVAWNDATGQIDAPGAGLYPVGVAVVAAGNGVTVARVRLDGITTAAL